MTREIDRVFCTSVWAMRAWLLLAVVGCGGPRQPADAPAGGRSTVHACPEYRPEPGAVACRGPNAQCPAGQVCRLPGLRVCGGAAAHPPCESDAACGPGRVCDMRPSCDQSPSCNGDCRLSECPEGWRCDRADGHCAPLACADDFACGSNLACVPGATGADDHGCVRSACESDSDCACGACIWGHCYDGPGTCEVPPA